MRNVLSLQLETINPTNNMAISIKSIPVLTGEAAANFVTEAEKNKTQATPTLSEKATTRLRQVLAKSKAFTF